MLVSIVQSLASIFLLSLAALMYWGGRSEKELYTDLKWHKQ